MGYKTNNT